MSKIYRVGKEIEVHALRGVNLKVYPGEVLVVMGPSGSGKTTLLNIVGTLDRPTSGRVVIDGLDVTDLPEGSLYDVRLKKIGFVFQFFNLIGTLTALENVMLPMILIGKMDKDDIREKAKELLKMVGLGDKLDSRPIQLSGGEQQRVAIARALANDPSIVLADEPTGNVDVESGAVILKIIQTLNKYLGTTFIVVTHNPEVSQIADRLIYIRGGRVFETKEIPRLKLDGALDERQILKVQLEFLKKELVTLRKRRMNRTISRSEYIERVTLIKERLERISRALVSRYE